MEYFDIVVLVLAYLTIKRTDMNIWRCSNLVIQLCWVYFFASITKKCKWTHSLAMIRESKGEKDEKKMRWIPFAKTTVSYKPFRSTKTWWWWWSPFHFRCAFCWHLLIRQHIVELIMVYNQNMTSTLTSTLTNKIPFVKKEQWKKTAR